MQRLCVEGIEETGVGEEAYVMFKEVYVFYSDNSFDRVGDNYRGGVGYKMIGLFI